MDRNQLHSLLPHQGQALWLDRLLDHDAQTIRGLSAWSYLDHLHDHASPCLLFEAAAQLCAAHGALYGDGGADRLATIGKIGRVQLHDEPAQRQGPLLVTAMQEAQSPTGASYRFSVHAEQRLLIDGNLLLVLGDA